MNWQILQKLARSYYYQTIYNRTKELNGIQLFNNTTEFSFIQFTFLQYLELYSSLYQDLYTKEPFISEAILEDDLRCEAYLLWKHERKGKKDSTKSSQTAFDSTVPGAVIFKKQVK
jgi:hypothetical protein